ncbi:uncharacterized protein LOC100233152 isoform X1 [Nasonia vitripennis]|uniref:Uncharacterized protein n=1 Tax=Nasonia vitripennis TaxID=7425 RepID=A0A7M6W5L6_NASVI|nr:uncharacterized protein LOC100233152 [Nasonia vitripennis]XP_008203319.1 uncharacterized protein LOC100233152 isoform X1 [Nasonia vitripennis]XP_032453623.1 uncharacterized protein LOC100233152 isoform X1 [Nasonia vitripennis]
MDGFIPTRAALKKKDAEKALVVTTFEAHKKAPSKPKVHSKKEKPVSRDSDDEMDDDDEPEEPLDERRKQELDMKRYRYDVIKFGMSGFEKKEARQAKIALAVSLGAIPPKNKRINYKRLLKERKEEKAREKKKEKFASGFSSNQLLMKFKKNDKPKINNRKEKDGILGIYGKVTKDNNHKRKGGGRVQKRKS